MILRRRLDCEGQGSFVQKLLWRLSCSWVRDSWVGALAGCWPQTPGWHMFRHMFSSILHQAGTSMAVLKELLGHANIQTTMNICTQAISAAKREAIHRVAELLLNA
jgi:integrase